MVYTGEPIYLYTIGKHKASKSAFPDFHGNVLKISNSDFATTLSDPDRLSVPNLVKIRQETAEELDNEKSV